MDQYGLLTMTVALVTLSIALTQGRREGWDSPYITTLFALGAVATGLFVLIEWRSPAPLVDLRLFRYVPFTLASLVVLLSTAAFRGTGVLTIVFAQQVLELTPLDVGWLLLTGNIAYGVAVVIAGRLSDRMNLSVLTSLGLGLFAFAFFWFADINETVGVGTLTLLLTLRLASYGVVGPPNNLSAMRSLPEEHVVMASGVFTLLRSISGTLGAAVSVTLYEQRYFSLVQRYGENHDVYALGVQEALTTVGSFLTAAGEVVSGLATRTSVVLQQRLLAEATTTAYQDYFLLAALTGLLSILPALPLQESWCALRQRLHPQAAADGVVEPGREARAVLVSPDTSHGAGVTTAEPGQKVAKP
jgi:MFS family permease